MPDPTVPDAYSLRLTGGTILLEGRVEIYYEDSWHTICGADWGMREALTVCRQLGLGSAVESGRWSSLVEITPTPKTADTNDDGGGASPDAGEGKEEDIGIVGVICADSTSSVTNCTVWKMDDGACNHTADAGVVCSETSTNGKTLTL